VCACVCTRSSSTTWAWWNSTGVQSLWKTLARYESQFSINKKNPACVCFPSPGTERRLPKLTPAKFNSATIQFVLYTIPLAVRIGFQYVNCVLKGFYWFLWLLFALSGGSKKILKAGGGAEDNLSAPSSFISNAHNEIYAFYHGKNRLFEKNVSHRLHCVWMCCCVCSWIYNFSNLNLLNDRLLPTNWRSILSFCVIYTVVVLVVLIVFVLRGCNAVLCGC